MTGASASQGYKVPKRTFNDFVDSLRTRLSVFGPVTRNGQTAFKEIQSSAELDFDYKSTMEPPSKTFFYRPRQEILRFSLPHPSPLSHGERDRVRGKVKVEEVIPPFESRIAIGIHPCDMNAILYLDKTFRTDPYYMALRDNTALIVLNCKSSTEFCFCASVGTGPHLKADSGYDLLVTDIGEDYLIEPKSERGNEFITSGWAVAVKGDFDKKNELESVLLKSFKKSIRMDGIDALFVENLSHPVWSETAERRCLSCSNCVMVCPTCFCHDIIDEVDMDLKTVERLRRWDACQDRGFAEVHGGNFRLRREARLRQFVMHKLDYTAQYGLPGTVGCGRCIRWCPTGIDLTEIAKEIMRSQNEKPAHAS